jgi:hypothetical protein
MTCELSAAGANEPARPGATLRYPPTLPPAYPIRRYGRLLGCLHDPPVLCPNWALCGSMASPADAGMSACQAARAFAVHGRRHLSVASSGECDRVVAADGPAVEH